MADDEEDPNLFGDDSDDEEFVEPELEAQRELDAQRSKQDSYKAALERCGITFQPTLLYLFNFQQQTDIDQLRILNIAEITSLVSTTNKTPHQVRGRVGSPNHIITAVAFKRLKAFRA